MCGLGRMPNLAIIANPDACKHLLADFRVWRSAPRTLMCETYASMQVFLRHNVRRATNIDQMQRSSMAQFIALHLCQPHLDEDGVKHLTDALESFLSEGLRPMDLQEIADLAVVTCHALYMGGSFSPVSSSGPASGGVNVSNARSGTTAENKSEYVSQQEYVPPPEGVELTPAQPLFLLRSLLHVIRHVIRAGGSTAQDMARAVFDPSWFCVILRSRQDDVEALEIVLHILTLLAPGSSEYTSKLRASGVFLLLREILPAHHMCAGLYKCMYRFLFPKCSHHDDGGDVVYKGADGVACVRADMYDMGELSKAFLAHSGGVATFIVSDVLGIVTSMLRANIRFEHAAMRVGAAGHSTDVDDDVQHADDDITGVSMPSPPIRSGVRVSGMPVSGMPVTAQTDRYTDAQSAGASGRMEQTESDQDADDGPRGGTNDHNNTSMAHADSDGNNTDRDTNTSGEKEHSCTGIPRTPASNSKSGSFDTKQNDHIARSEADASSSSKKSFTASPLMAPASISEIRRAPSSTELRQNAVSIVRRLTQAGMRDSADITAMNCTTVQFLLTLLERDNGFRTECCRSEGFFEALAGLLFLTDDVYSALDDRGSDDVTLTKVTGQVMRKIGHLLGMTTTTSQNAHTPAAPLSTGLTTAAGANFQEAPQRERIASTDNDWEECMDMDEDVTTDGHNNTDMYDLSRDDPAVLVPGVSGTAGNNGGKGGMCESPTGRVVLEFISRVLEECVRSQVKGSNAVHVVLESVPVAVLESEERAFGTKLVSSLCKYLCIGNVERDLAGNVELARNLEVGLVCVCVCVCFGLYALFHL
jgi:hypothetical protein